MPGGSLSAAASQGTRDVASRWRHRRCCCHSNETRDTQSARSPAPATRTRNDGCNDQTSHQHCTSSESVSSYACLGIIMPYALTPLPPPPPKVRSVAARGCLPPGANVFVATPTPSIRSPVDILMVTTMVLVWTANSTLSWKCNYVMQWNLGWSVATANANANSPEAAKFQNSIFLPLQMPPPAQRRPGRMPPPPSSSFPPPLSTISIRPSLHPSFHPFVSLSVPCL